MAQVVPFQSTSASGRQVARAHSRPEGLDCSDRRGLTLRDTRCATAVAPRAMHARRRHFPLSASHLGVLLACCAGFNPAFAAATCEELQQSIEARIRASGVASFTVTTVDAAASAPGQVVGTCDQGRKKLLYARGAAASAPAKQRPAASAVITECADGRVLTEGSCKK